MTNEPLGIAKERAANRAKYAWKHYVAPQDRIPLEHAAPPPIIVAPPAAITMPMAVSSPRAKVAAIMAKFCEIYSELSHEDLTVSDLLSTTRQRKPAWARHVCMLLVHEATKYSTTAIGKIFRRDHTTVIYGLIAAKHHLTEDAALELTYDRVREFFGMST